MNIIHFYKISVLVKGKVLNYVFKSFLVNYGSLLLKALLENWWTAVHADEENEMAGDSLPPQARIGNEYFKVPGHTPLIFRSVFVHIIHLLVFKAFENC